MSKYFAENPGAIEVQSWYADNEICLREVRFSVPASKWNEFVNSNLYRELVGYVDSLRTQDMHTDSHEPQCKLENELFLHELGKPNPHISVLAQARNLLFRRK